MMAASQALAAAGLPAESLPVQYFRRAFSRKRLSHAYLFLGPEGSGRRRFAREVARAVFCPAGTPCGSCPSCAAVEHGNHPAVHVYGPREGKGAVEIDEVRDLSARVHLRRADFLVAVIEEAEQMTLPASNAILKTLEEPTGAAMLILVSRSAGALLPTIVSRCHRILFAPLLEGGPPEAHPPQEGAAPSLPGAASALPAGALEALAREDLYLDWEPKEWLSGLYPDQAPREAARRLVDDLIARSREGWSPPASRGGDPTADRLEALLDLRADLDRNVNPDLVLEAVVREFRLNFSRP